MKITSVQTFGTPTIGDYYRFAQDEFIKVLQDYPAEKLVGSNTDELITFFLQKYSLSPIEIDDSRQVEVEKIIKKEEYTTMFGESATKDVIKARITFPLKPARDLVESFKYHSETYTAKSYEFDFNDLESTVSIEAQPEAMQSAIDEHINLYNHRSAAIIENNIHLKEFIRTKVEERIKTIKNDDELFDSMLQKVTIPLKRKSDPTDYHVPLQIRQELTYLKEPTADKPKELILTDEQLNSIIEVINSDGRNFENTPVTFSKLEEPDLRNIILSHLNLYFPDDATGETFVGLGKADIRLKVFQGQILIAECKYWYGESEFVKAIDQLFSYLTWRHNYGILIIFSKNQNFSEVQEKIKTTLRNHQTYKGELKEISLTHYRSNHLFPNDSSKIVEVHTLAYDLSNKK